jgi:hypothetical protein
LDVGSTFLGARGFGGSGPIEGSASGGAVDFTVLSEPITGTSLEIDSGGSVTVANVELSSDLTILAEGLVTVRGGVIAPFISVLSPDIDIVSGAALGARGLSTIFLTALETWCPDGHRRRTEGPGTRSQRAKYRALEHCHSRSLHPRSARIRGGSPTSWFEI